MLRYQTVYVPLCTVFDAFCKNITLILVKNTRYIIAIPVFFPAHTVVYSVFHLKIPVNHGTLIIFEDQAFIVDHPVPGLDGPEEILSNSKDHRSIHLPQLILRINHIAHQIDLIFFFLQKPACILCAHPVLRHFENLCRPFLVDIAVIKCLCIPRPPCRLFSHPFYVKSSDWHGAAKMFIAKCPDVLPVFSRTFLLNLRLRSLDTLKKRLVGHKFICGLQQTFCAVF